MIGCLILNLSCIARRELGEATEWTQGTERALDREQGDCQLIPV